MHLRQIQDDFFRIVLETPISIGGTCAWPIDIERDERASQESRSMQEKNTPELWDKIWERSIPLAENQFQKTRIHETKLSGAA